ncbi:MAG: hypothetical protein JW910_22955 [Anaerolineae bacterium]|nr:hypothetical protein [Anaerolineae bacterium]
MTTGQTRYADISTILPDIYEGALFTLRQTNVLVRTVSVFRDTMSMVPRKNSQYGAANPRAVSEGEDVTATQLSRSALSTLTPARYADQFLLTDERIRSDDQNVRADAALELGAAFAVYVDEQIAGNFSSLTGGTIGTAGGTLTWDSIINARAMMQTLKVPPPYFCALHPYQWGYLVKSALTGTQINNAPAFQDALVSTYFVSSLVAGVVFVVTPSITVNSSDDATGAMYSPRALAYDERQAFAIEPERDASRQAWELNANLHFAHGTWAPARGIQLVGDAATPSS